MNTPYHHHDSESSIYLGSEVYKDKKYDFYYQEQSVSPTVIARFGELGDYVSGLVFIKSLINKNLDIKQQLNNLLKVDDEDIYLLAKATVLSIEKGVLTKELKQDDRACAIVALEKNLNNVLEVLINDNSFHEHVKEHYKKYYTHYKGLKDCYNCEKSDLRDNIVEKYTGSCSKGYSYVSTESIVLENRIWNFVQNNEVQWHCMIEHIKHNENSSNLKTIEGFSFVDSFIHNGIYDDMPLNIAKKDNDILFVHVSEDKIVNNLIKQGYEIKFLDEESMVELLNELEPKKIKTPKMK